MSTKLTIFLRNFVRPYVLNCIIGISSTTTEGVISELQQYYNNQPFDVNVVSKYLHQTVIYHSLLPVKSLVLKDIDGNVIETKKSVHSLRRYFQTIDSCMEAVMEEEVVMKIPHTTEVIEKALFGMHAEGGKLKECVECIQWLMPKDVTYYLRYKWNEYYDEDLVNDIVYNMDIATKLFNVKAVQYAVNFEHIPILTIMARRREKQFVLRELQGHPCKILVYLIKESMKTGDKKSVITYLLNTDFGTVVDIMNDFDVLSCLPVIIALYMEDSAWEEDVKLLAMLGIRDDCLDNMDMKVSLPCAGYRLPSSHKVVYTVKCCMYQKHGSKCDIWKEYKALDREFFDLCLATLGDGGQPQE